MKALAETVRLLGVFNMAAALQKSEVPVERRESLTIVVVGVYCFKVYFFCFTVFFQQLGSVNRRVNRPAILVPR